MRRVGVARALSKLGITSRGTAAQWIQAGRVTLNGRVVRDPETPVVMERDRLCVDGVTATVAARHYVMLNKPRGLVTTAHDEQGRATVYQCLDNATRWLAPVGRLDKASEGLLLFSNDSEWASHLLDPLTHLPKVYHVQIDRLPDESLLEKMRRGVKLDDGTMLRVNEVTPLRSGDKNSWLAVTLHEGKNRHIRRLLDVLTVKALRLIRVAIGPLQLGELPKGKTRPLTMAELQALAAAMQSGKGD